MAQDPCSRDRILGDTIFFRKLVEYLIQFREFLISDKDSLKHAVLERRPRLQRQLFQTCILDQTSVAAAAGIVVDIDVQACINRRAVCRRELDLIDADFSATVLIQQFDLHRIVVADAKYFYLAGFPASGAVPVRGSGEKIPV